ncbi:MAG: hypothetical protein H7039_17860 [Bryobacteraceae bacterium]|nr:hypothetical protein [Bryobacteraceae bacterium]
MTNINLEHPEYNQCKGMWRKYRDLYVGGEQMKANAPDYLAQRQKEPADVYRERLNRVFYENYIGSIVDWYAATLFRREPQLILEGTHKGGRKFFSQFAEDCDLKGTSISDFFRGRLIDTLITGRSYILIDFPQGPDQVGSRAEEDALGLSRAYMVDFPAEALINWSHDARGNYEWIMLRSTYFRKSDVDSDHGTRETIWRYYDREHYKIWRQVAQGDADPAEQDSEPDLIAEGTHALASQQRVPLFELKVSDGLWLMNKAGNLQLEHFNKSNALAWALNVGLFATPVVYSERDWNQIVGESYYIQLGPNDRFGWTEPEGKVYQIAADNLTRLQEEIYRVCYLMTQSGGSASSAAAQSGLSKLRDFAITQEVLRAYGDAVKDCMKRILRSVEQAREDDLQIDVSGLDDFDLRDFTSDLEEAEKLLSLGINSPTLRKQVYKRLAFKYLSDVRQEVKDEIAGEIDRSFAALE